ncbi:hypothetical protein ACOMHN_000919 [Nucella lapillus]
MTSDLEYLLLKEKGPYHEVYVRRRLNTNPGACKFYAIVITIITISLLLLLLSLVYVFVLVPSWQGNVLSWDGRPDKEARIHVLTHTQCGLVEGLVEKGVYVFKGIPYAEPPVGSRRWREPRKMPREPRTCWRGTLQAKTFRSSCVQPQGFKNFSLVGNEDCLFLNVWTQSLDPLANRPVMFWIHGGDFVHGSGNAPPMSPTPDVTKSTHAVYVSINYRLGPFGFLALDVLSRNSSHGTSGNYGLLDTVLALEWVRDNIRNFGGNPNKVTVFGQGSGATLIQALLATTSTPSIAGLFHRAWLASAPGVLIQSSAQAGRQNLDLLNDTGCHDATCLRKLSPVEVMRGAPMWARSSSFMGGLGDSWARMPVKGRRLDTSKGVVVDGKLLKEPPLQAWKYGRRHDVPLMLSTMAQETDLLPFDPTMTSWSWQHYKATVTEQLTPISPSLIRPALQQYPPDSTLTPEYQYTTMLSDIRMTCPSQVSADLASRKFRSPVFRAVITSSPSTPVNLLNVSAACYSFHGWDLMVFFGDFAAFGFHPTAEDLQFQKLLRQQMMSFAREGRPEAAVWDVSRMCTALLSDHVFPVEHYRKSRCEFWLKNKFVPYGSM